jgi:hypothetical protein
MNINPEREEILDSTEMQAELRNFLHGRNEIPFLVADGQKQVSGDISGTLPGEAVYGGTFTSNEWKRRSADPLTQAHHDMLDSAEEEYLQGRADAAAIYHEQRLPDYHLNSVRTPYHEYLDEQAKVFTEQLKGEALKEKLLEAAKRMLMEAWQAFQAFPSQDNLNTVKYWFSEAQLDDASLSAWYNPAETTITMKIGNDVFSKTYQNVTDEKNPINYEMKSFITVEDSDEGVDNVVKLLVGMLNSTISLLDEIIEEVDGMEGQQWVVTDAKWEEKSSTE